MPLIAIQKKILPFVLMLPMNALCWGPTGHRAIGLIAEKHLSPSAKKQTIKLLGDKSLAQVSTWADDIKSNPQHNLKKTWHYTTIGDKGTYAKAIKSPLGDIVIAINKQIIALKNKKTSKYQKQMALKLLVHLIGDIHQPLHVGRPGDRGGNSIKILFFQKTSNLHRLWDEDIINHSQLSFTELSHFSDRTSQFKKKWLHTTAEDWANEAVELRGAVYNFNDFYIKPYSTKHLTMTPKLFSKGKMPKISWQYRTRNWPIMLKQIQKSGRRLAHVLNTIY